MFFLYLNINIMKLVTVATQSERYFPWLEQSCKRFNVNLTVLGWGEKWKGFSWKIYLLVKYLKSVEPDEIVCFIDAYDVILLKPLQELEKRFIELHQKTGCKIVVGQDKALNAFHKFIVKSIFGSCNKSNINAGTYIGYAKDLITLLKGAYQLDPRFDSDDQVLLVKYCNIVPDAFYIDDESYCFFTYTNPLQLTGHQLYEQDACILHAPGTTNITSFLKEQGYKFTTEEERELNTILNQAFIQKVFHYIHKFKLAYIIPVIIIIILIIRMYKLFYQK